MPLLQDFVFVPIVRPGPLSQTWETALVSKTRISVIKGSPYGVDILEGKDVLIHCDGWMSLSALCEINEGSVQALIRVYEAWMLEYPRSNQLPMLVAQAEVFFPEWKSALDAWALTRVF